MIRPLLDLLDARGYTLIAYAGGVALVDKLEGPHRYVTWRWTGAELVHGNYFSELDAEGAEDDFYKRMGPCICSH